MAKKDIFKIIDFYLLYLLKSIHVFVLRDFSSNKEVKYDIHFPKFYGIKASIHGERKAERNQQISADPFPFLHPKQKLRGYILGIHW